MPPTEPYTPDDSWPEKFRCAFRGLRRGVRGQKSFLAHFALAAAVVVCAALMRVSLLEWCILLSSITVVLTAEMLNSALEWMARAISDEEHDYLGTALDIGAAAVLIASLGASLVGLIVFLHRLGVLLGWWTNLLR